MRITVEKIGILSLIRERDGDVFLNWGGFFFFLYKTAVFGRL